MVTAVEVGAVNQACGNWMPLIPALAKARQLSSATLT
jgi:hypothetical protein